MSDNRRQSGAGDAPLKQTGKEQIQQKVEKRSEQDKIKRMLGIAHTPKYSGNHVVAKGKKQTDTTDDKIVRSHCGSFRRRA